MDTSQLDRLCDAFRRRLKALLARAGVCRVLILALALLPLLLLLDWWVHLPTPWRCLALLAYLGALGSTLWWTLLSPASRLWRDEEVLAYLDSVLPREQGMLLELHQLMRGEGIQELEGPLGRSMADSAIGHLGPLAEQAERSETIERRRVRRWTRAAGLVAVLFVAAAVPLGEYLAIGCERLFNPFSERRWPHRTTISLEEPETGWTIPQMEAFTVHATVTGVVPAHILLAYRGESTGHWIKEKVPVRDGGSARYTFPEVREPMRFYVRGGDYTTDVFRIEIVERPYLKRIVAHYDYPDYAGIPDRAVDGGQLVGLEGTKVRLDFECSMALDKALFILAHPAVGATHASPTGEAVPRPYNEGKQPEPMPLTSETTFEKTMYLSADGSYSIELYEKHGFREARPERYEVRVTPDNPPEVELLSPGRDLVATRRAAIEVAFRASDDFGLETIQFLYQIDEGEPAPLSDRVTGPLEPTGKTKAARFNWDLRAMELPEAATLPEAASLREVPEAAVLSYFVRVRDVNPTGRGVVETAKLRIKLVKPSEFHFETFERAKRIEAEARIAWESQYAAWQLASQWPANGSGNEDDPLWREMKEKQDLAIRAAEAMEAYLRDLTEQYEQNDMARELMAGRLGIIAGLLRRVTETEHPAIAAGLGQARPKTDADAAPARLEALRSAALARVASNQKLATLYLEALVKRIFDWRDLQTTLIRTTVLHEEQGEVLELTEKIAPKTLGWELEDLPDDVQDKLLTLGKRQRTLYEVETELEKELEFQIHRAETQARRSILDPLRTAYAGLRENRVNDNLKLAARKIENNQAFQIVRNQKAALHVLDIVRGGLIHAGQKVEAEPRITLAMAPSKIIEVRPKPKPEAAEDPEATDPVGPAEIATISPEELLANLPLGSDPVTMAINVTWEAQDAVLARTRYLAANCSPAEMPRYVRLKQGILLEKQSGALKAVDLAVREAGKAGSAPVQAMLDSVKEELVQSRQLIEGMHLGGGTQQIQDDAMATLDDLRRRFIPLQRSVEESAEENRRRSGADAFDRKYLIRDEDLEHATAIVKGLSHTQLLQRDVVRKLARFVKFPPKGPALAKAERANRAKAATLQRQAAGLLADAGKEFAALSHEVAPKVGAAGLLGNLREVGNLPEDVQGRIQSGGEDEELRASLQEAADLLAQTIRGLKDLLGERVRPTRRQRKPPGGSQPPGGCRGEITLEEWRRMRSPEALREKLKTEARLPAEVREIMLRALSKGFPPRYRELLSAYYASFISEEKKK